MWCQSIKRFASFRGPVLMKTQVVFLMVVLLVEACSASSAPLPVTATQDDAGPPSGRPAPSCSSSPPPPLSDGIGILHLGLNVQYEYDLEASWNLSLAPDRSERHSLPPKTSNSGLAWGSLTVTRISGSQVQVVLKSVTYSGKKPHGRTVEEEEVRQSKDERFLVEVSDGAVVAFCGSSSPDKHGQDLVRSVIGAILNTATSMDPAVFVHEERDTWGRCPTQYKVEEGAGGWRHVTRSRDLTSCLTDGGHSPLHSIANQAIWHCKQGYSVDWDSSYSPQSETNRSLLTDVKCSQRVMMDQVATLNSFIGLDLQRSSFLQPTSFDTLENLLVTPSSEAFVPEDYEKDDPRVAVDVEHGSPWSKSYRHAWKILVNMCTSLEDGVTSDVALAYPDLLRVLRRLPEKLLVKIFKRVYSGDLCATHKKLRSVVQDALGDVGSSASAAASCSLVTSAIVPFSPPWASALASVERPTIRVLEACKDLLDVSQSSSTVLGVSIVAGKLARQSCPPRSPEGPSKQLKDLRDTKDECGLQIEVADVVGKLLSMVGDCSFHDDFEKDRVLLGLAGLGNVGAFGQRAEEVLLSCGKAKGAEEVGIDVAAVRAFRRGFFTKQAFTWLKWTVLNETLGPEVRIAAFQALGAGHADVARVIAHLLLDRNTNSQVKSYVSSIVERRGSRDDIREFSQKVRLNLTSLFGIEDTNLDLDIIFQNSYIPRSLALDLHSHLLRHFGGSLQLGGRLENLEQIIQALYPDGSLAMDDLPEWLAEVGETIKDSVMRMLKKKQEKNRSKRSFSLSDIQNLLKRVRRDVDTTLRGWLWGGSGGQERFFANYAMDPLAIEWTSLLQERIEGILDSFYASLVSSNFEAMMSMAVVEHEALVWNLAGGPVLLTHQEGFLASVEASSKVDLFKLLTNPTSTTLDATIHPSIAIYRKLSVNVASLDDVTSASTHSSLSTGINLSTNLNVRSGDRVTLKVDLPENAFNGVKVSSRTSLSIPKVDEREKERGTKTCHRDLETAVGLRACQETLASESPSSVQETYLYTLEKEDRGIKGYSLTFSWKNPATNSLFLDMEIEAEGSIANKRAGLVFGLTTEPNYHLRVLLHSPNFNAEAEVSLVNDPNLKRFEAHTKINKLEYGVKMEILMVTDGSQVTLKPRFVLSRPNTQEDSILEGYMSFFLSDKVRSVAADLVTDGTLKNYLDAAIKGTVEYRTPPTGETTLSLKNVHLHTPNATLGLEASVVAKKNSFETQIQVTWDGEVVMLGGGVNDQSSGRDHSHYFTFFHLLTPSRPNLDTRITCHTKIFQHEITNNLTVALGPEDQHQAFQALHSTSWRGYNRRSTLRQHQHQSPRPFAQAMFELSNKVKMEYPPSKWSLDIEHDFQISPNALENLLRVHLDDREYRIMANLQDQSQERFKFHMEIEVSFPDLFFTYVDTLQQRPEGDVVGQSITTMPSGRVYSSSSRFLFRSNEDELVLSTYYDVRANEDQQEFKISAQQALEFRRDHLSFHASVHLGQLPLFGLEFSLDGWTSSMLELYFKNFVHELYDAEVMVSSSDFKADVSLTLLILPYDREIRSKVAVGQAVGCWGATLDGEAAWDVRRDASRALKLSTVLEMPDESNTIHIRNTLGLFGLGWTSQLVIELGQTLGDPHSVRLVVTLPGDRKFEAGSNLVLRLGDTEAVLSAAVDMKMPHQPVHKAQLDARHVRQGEVRDAVVTLFVESPVVEEIYLNLRGKTQSGLNRRDVSISIKSYSEAGYWDSLDSSLAWVWDNTNMKLIFEGGYGNDTLNIDAHGLYRIDGGKHLIRSATEIRFPGHLWQQLKASVDASLNMMAKPAGFTIFQSFVVERNYNEIFSSNGELEMFLPKAEGRLFVHYPEGRIKQQTYELQGNFELPRVDVRVSGSLDNSIMEGEIIYDDGSVLEVKVNIATSSVTQLHLSLKTRMDNISIGLRKQTALPSYSVMTEGLAVYHGERIKLFHIINVTESHVDTLLTLTPLLGHTLKLNTTVKKISPNLHATNANIEWGQETLHYTDDIYLGDRQNFRIKFNVDAPFLDIYDVSGHIETTNKNNTGNVLLLSYVENTVVIHSARLMFHRLKEASLQRLKMSASNLVIQERPYEDFMIEHDFNTESFEMSSKLTVANTPILGVGVVASSTVRAFSTAVCSTHDECLRLKASASYSQENSTTKTYSLDVHALNSLLWSHPEDPLIENSLSLTAQQKDPQKILVSGGLRRIQCRQVTCEQFEQQGFLHFSLNLDNDKMNFVLDTTNRTIELQTLMRKSLPAEVGVATLPGGRLRWSTTAETRLWLNRGRDVTGDIQFNTTISSFASARATEFAFDVSLFQEAIDKVMRGRADFALMPEKLMVDVFLDAFATPREALELKVNLQQKQGHHVLVANFTHPYRPDPGLADVSVVLVPSPDHGTVALSVKLPGGQKRRRSTRRGRRGRNPLPVASRWAKEVVFEFQCWIDASTGHVLLHCRVKSPSVNEYISVKYEKYDGVLAHPIATTPEGVDDDLTEDGYSFDDDNLLMALRRKGSRRSKQHFQGGCGGFGASVDIFNRSYDVTHVLCTQLPSLQTSITRQNGAVEDELALRLGLVDVRKAEIHVANVVDASLNLHPPFLLHLASTPKESVTTIWSSIKRDLWLQAMEIKTLAQATCRVMAEDIRTLEVLGVSHSLSHVVQLGDYVTQEVRAAALELKEDPLIQDLAQGVRACYQVSSLIPDSVLIEAALAYLDPTFGSLGDAIASVGANLYQWMMECVKQATTVVTTAKDALYDAARTTWTNITNLPEVLLEQALVFPWLSTTASRVMAWWQQLNESRFLRAAWSVARELAGLVHKVLSYLYSEEVPDGPVAPGNLWLPLPKARYSLYELLGLAKSDRRGGPYRKSIFQALGNAWHIISYPPVFLSTVLPPFPGHASVIGTTEIITFDGRSFSVKEGCNYLLFSRGEGNGTHPVLPALSLATGHSLRWKTPRRDYTLVVGDDIIHIDHKLQVTHNHQPVTLPAYAKSFSITRTSDSLYASVYVGDMKSSNSTEDETTSARRILLLWCHLKHSACMLRMSGWLQNQAQGILGNFNHDPGDDFTRPNGKVSLVADMFAESWQVGKSCKPHRSRRAKEDVRSLNKTTFSHKDGLSNSSMVWQDTLIRRQELCHSYILHYESSVFSCHDTEDATPYHHTCLHHMSRHSLSEVDPVGADRDALCDVLLAYSQVCKQKGSPVFPPPFCTQHLTYKEELAPKNQMDVVMLVEEDQCDKYIYDEFVTPFPDVLQREARQADIRDVRMSVLGYHGFKDRRDGHSYVTYYVMSSSSLLVPSSQLPDVLPSSLTQRADNSSGAGLTANRGSVVHALRAINTFPMRPGSVRVGIVVACSFQDLPAFSESLLAEMRRRRLMLHVVVPGVLTSDPRRPTRARNTIGLDERYIYSLQRNRKPVSGRTRFSSSNLSLLALKSGGSMFTMEGIRGTPKETYYARKIRRVLATTIVESSRVYYESSNRQYDNPHQ
ncbi:uncharacterized protein LOC143033306 isoform X2 [Oratosquilla oratoria]|uniref:uncharacterized protein LOC143033306 isoform X2 n=1 Tax=Oratosquilla oratoria TaxID=337810 RepID=UPI003F76B8C5